jgi:uncharacterized membrane protein
MALGYVAGLRWRQVSRRALAICGALALASFVVLRLTSAYGDPHPYAPLEGVRSVFAFLAVHKYPPSLQYLLVTLGPAALALAALRGRHLDGPGSRVLVTLGRVPLFFYLLHVPLVHLLSFPFRAARGLPMVGSLFRHGLDLPLWVVYAMTAVALALLWLPCRRWAELKAARPGGWRSYL